MTSAAANSAAIALNRVAASILTRPIEELSVWRATKAFRSESRQLFLPQRSPPRSGRGLM